MDSRTWRRDLAPYLDIDSARSLGQIASVVLPYLALWALTAAAHPTAPAAIALGLLALPRPDPQLAVRLAPGQRGLALHPVQRGGRQRRARRLVHLPARAGGDWDFERAALQASSYRRLPRPLAWAVGNATYHHVHPLSAKIPNYRLRAAHEQQAIFADAPLVTIRSGLQALRLELWDERRGRLVVQ